MDSRLVARMSVLALLGVASACGTESAACVNPPCPQPLAIRITLVDGATGKPVPSATVGVSGVESEQLSCQTGSGCDVFGPSGAYTLAVTAPGYRGARQQVQVTGTRATCGCGSVDTQHLTLALAPTG